MEPEDYEKFITSMKSMCGTSLQVCTVLLSDSVAYGNVAGEKQLKQRIRNLMICRKNGITKSEGKLLATGLVSCSYELVLITCGLSDNPFFLLVWGCCVLVAFSLLQNNLFLLQNNLFVRPLFSPLSLRLCRIRSAEDGTGPTNKEGKGGCVLESPFQRQGVMICCFWLPWMMQESSLEPGYVWRFACEHVITSWFGPCSVTFLLIGKTAVREFLVSSCL